MLHYSTRKQTGVYIDSIKAKAGGLVVRAFRLKSEGCEFVASKAANRL